MKWFKEQPLIDGYYWCKREEETTACIVEIWSSEDQAGKYILEFGYDSDRQALLSEWLEWTPRGAFWGPIQPPP